MADVKKTDVTYVMVSVRSTELEQLHEIELAAAMVGGEVGRAVLKALAGVHGAVSERAV